jgi:hypothetical protein
MVTPLATTALGTNATLGNVRFSAGYEGEADISRSLMIDRDCTRASLATFRRKLMFSGLASMERTRQNPPNDGRGLKS